MDQLPAAINKELETLGLLVKNGIKVDASLTSTALKPKGKVRYQIAEDRKEDEVSNREQDKQSES